MKTEDGNEALHPWIEPEIEARLTALVLGEASDFERDELERLVATRPELGLYRKRLETMHRLLREVTVGEDAEGQGEWKLAPERRAAVLERFGSEIVPAETVFAGLPKRNPWRLSLRVLALAAAVVMVGLLLGLFFPASTGTLQLWGSGGKIPRNVLAYYDTANNAEAAKTADPFFRQEARNPIPSSVGTGSSTSGGLAGGGDSDADLSRLQRSQHERQHRPELPSPRSDLNFEAEGLALAAPAIRPPASTTAAPEVPAGPMGANPSNQLGALNGTVAFGAGGEFSVGGGFDGREVVGRPLERNRTSSAPEVPTTPPGVFFGDSFAITNPSSAAETRGTAMRTEGETGLAAVADAQAEIKAQTGLGIPLVEVERLKSLERFAEETRTTMPAGAPSAGKRELAEKEIPATKEPESVGASQFTQTEIEGRHPTRDQVVRKAPPMSDETPPASEKLQRYDDIDNGAGDSDKKSTDRDVTIQSSDFTAQAGVIVTPADPEPAAKPIRLYADPVSGPVAAGEPVAEEQLKRMREGSLAQNREAEAEVAEFDGFIQFAQGGSASANAPAAREKSKETGASHDKGKLAGLDGEFGNGGMIDLSGKDTQESAFSRIGLIPLDPLTRSEAGQKKDASELDRLSEVDKSVRDILALTPKLDQSTNARGIPWDHLQASTGAGGAMRSSGGVISAGTIELNAKPAEPTAATSQPVAVLGDAGSKIIVMGALINASENEDGTVNLGSPTSSSVNVANGVTFQARNQFPAVRLPTPAALDETSPVAEPFSTFSLHVSDVSFQLAKAALASGKWPEADKIRIEEFVNAFDYGDPMPGMGERVACRIDQAAHPFLQQRNLVRIALRTAEAGRSAGTPLRLTLLLDSSGSMERPDRRETVRRAVATLAGLLGENDRITLVSFARQPRLVADAVAGNEAMKLAETVAALPSEGGTNLEAALRLAFEKAREHQDSHAQNRIVLLTDGAANLGDAKAESLAAQVETMREAGIAFDAAGIGAEGLNDEVLEALTRKGDGRYYLLDRPEDAEDAFAKQIAGALRPAAKNVKVQVEFHPDRVKSYKLLGFEKHRLATEDFRNDAVDAAEMAAAEAGVAVYQVEPNPAGEGDLGSVSVRFRDLDSDEMVERRWALPHLASAPRAGRGGDAILLATVASQFAAKLAGGPLGDVVDLGELASLAAALPDSPRVAELRTMIEQARAIQGSF